MFPGAVLVSSTKYPGIPAQRYTREEWEAFIAGVKAGEFDFTPRNVNA